MDRTELAWAAGFWDGEGSAYLTGSSDRATKQPQARIDQSSTAGIPDVLVRFRAAVGFGVVQGPDLAEGREPLYRYVVSNRAEIEKLMGSLSPFLGAVKRSQLERVVGKRAPHPAGWGHLSEDERHAWAAGLWDGEGSVCLLKHRSHEGHLVPEASVTQSSTAGVPEVLTRIGSIGPTGFVYGPFPQEPPYSPVYRWKLFRIDEIRRLMDHLWPWLGPVKIAQAERVFSVLGSQPKLPRGNPAWGDRKTHCVRGHEYATARSRPFKGRGKNTEPPRASHQCLRCVRDDARARRLARKCRAVADQPPLM